MKNSEQLGFRWITLRLYNVPIIDKQIEKIQAIFNQLRSQILDGDILSVQKMSSLQLSIKRRIKQMDQFYDKNCMDERVRYLQTGRMKLLRLISHDRLTRFQKGEMPLFMEETSRNSPRIKTNRTSKNVTPKNLDRKEQIKKKSPFRGSKQPKKQNDQESHIGNQFLIPTSPYSNFQQSDRKPKKTTEIKTNRKTEFIPVKNNNKKESVPSTHRNRLSDRSKTETNEGKNSLKKLNDLIFTIKMTKEEYSNFMEIKEKMQNQS